LCISGEDNSGCIRSNDLRTELMAIEDLDRSQCYSTGGLSFAVTLQCCMTTFEGRGTLRFNFNYGVARFVHTRAATRAPADGPHYRFVDFFENEWKILTLYPVRQFGSAPVAQIGALPTLRRVHRPQSSVYCSSILQCTGPRSPTQLSRVLHGWRLRGRASEDRLQHSCRTCTIILNL